MANRLKTAVKLIVLLLFVRPFVWFFLGLNRYARLRVTPTGPCILAPTHNSHLDTLLVMGLLPLSVATRTRVVAAADYFGSIPVLSWLLFSVFDMVPVWRRGKAPDGSPRPNAIDAMANVVDQGHVIMLYPEGTRGQPEQRVSLKHGVARLAQRFPEVPVYPIYLRGLGKALPRGDVIFVPLIPQVALGEPMYGRDHDDEAAFMAALETSFDALEIRINKSDWVPA